MTFTKVKIEIYIPETFIKTLTEQLTVIGACRIGDYDHVVSYSKVFRYWRPLENSNPVNGLKDIINSGEECKMEVICPYDLLARAIDTIKTVHPYEEPAINVIPLLDYM